jgi:mitochondrial fission protein ELM1
VGKQGRGAQRTDHSGSSLRFAGEKTVYSLDARQRVLPMNRSDDAGSAPAAHPPPRVWLLTGHKAGDNTQVVALAGALGWAFELKRFAYQPWELLSNRLLRVTLAGIDRPGSSPLEPPWPDLIITAGRRNEPVARWIRAQSDGYSRLVHVGRPWASLDCFDLIVATPQYFLPPRPNILRIDLPLHRITPAGLVELATQRAEQFSHLPRPYWSVLLGGDGGPFVFTVNKALCLARWLNARLRTEGGSLLVTNSARTPEPTFAAFLAALEAPMSVYHWADPTAENPYQAYLALADRLVVTGESMSMLAEASITGKPLYIYDLSDCPAGDVGASGGCRPWWTYRHNLRFKPLSHRLAMVLAPRRMRGDVDRIQAHLVTSGRAVWVGQEWRSGSRPQQSDLERAAARVRALFDAPTSQQ